MRCDGLLCDLLFGVRGSRVCVGLSSGLDGCVGLSSGLELLFGFGCRVYGGLLFGLDFRMSVFDWGSWCLGQGWGFWCGFDWVCGAVGGAEVQGRG